MSKINPLMYMTNWDPIPEPIIQASGWFLTEQMTIDAPSGSEVSIGWFQAQGWGVTNTERITKTTQSLGGGTTITSTDGFRYTLRRRKLQSELVLQDMIDQYTKGYNEGRLLNNRRYQEILLVYNAMLGKTQDEILDVDLQSGQYEGLIDQVIASIPSDYDVHKAEVTGMLDEYGESMRGEINLRFDNELAKAKQSLVSRGMHNTLLLNSVAAGIEQQRQKALLELDDRLVDKKLSQSDRLYQLRTDMQSRLESSAKSLAQMKRSNKMGAIEFRNAIITAMATFMANRIDEYPGVAELAKLAAGLGYGEGSSVRA